MITASWRVVVNRPFAEVFDYVADLRNEPEWNANAATVVLRTAGQVGPDAIFEEDVRPIGRCITTFFIYEPPVQVGFDRRHPRIDTLIRYSFTPLGDRATGVDCITLLTAKGFLRWIAPLIAPLIRRRIARHSGRDLKMTLEQ